VWHRVAVGGEHVVVAEVVPNEELRAFLLRFYAVLESGDVEAFREMFSSSPQVLVAGSDPREWLVGQAGVDVFATQLGEMSFRIEPGEIRAFSAGNVGWVADQGRTHLANGVEATTRVTAVLVIERGHWRIIQWHAATPVNNEDSIGYTLTTGVEHLAEVVRDEQPDVRPAAAPDGTVTIAFTDIESSTVLLERLGDTEFVRMLAWHDRIVRDAAEEHRGYVVKSQGDGFMLAFPSAAYALRSCVVMRDRLADGFDGLPVRVRAGLHCGETLRHDDDFYGRTVVIAARISSLALGGEILASDLVHALARGLGTFTFGEPRPATLKGLAGEFTLYPVIT
jgi:class 3 adenylate cyclase